MDRTTLFMAAGTAAVVFLILLFVSEVNFDGMKAAVKSTKTDAEKALDAGELDTETARTVLALKRAGVHVTLAELDAAKNDAPDSRFYGTIAEIAKPTFESLNPRDADREPHRVVCFSERRENGVSHDIVYYNDAHLYKMGDMGLYAWIRSGCAAAIRTSKQTQSSTAYMGKILALVPKDDLHEWVRDSISANMFMTCNEETRQRLKGFSEARRTEMSMRESDRCRKLSKF